MAETFSCGDGNIESEENDELDLKNFLKPNKRKHEEEIALLTTRIQELETLIKSLTQAIEQKKVELQKIRVKMQEMIEHRKNVDGALRTVNTDIGKQNAEMTKVESNLRYKSEDATNKTIRKLEDQLKMHNFRLSEERRIVAEVDALKRSKRALGQYLTLKNEVFALKDKAKKLRQDLDYYHNEVRTLRQKEDSINHDFRVDKPKLAACKKELDEHYARRRACSAEYQNQRKDYQTSLYKQRQRKHQEFHRKKVEVQQQKQEAYEKELAEFEAGRQPHSEEIHLCDTLISYLQRFVSEPEMNINSPDSGKEEARLDQSLTEEGVYVLRKKSDDNLFGGMTKSKSRKNKKDKRRSLSNKPIHHDREIFEQFAKLHLTAPATTSTVSMSIESLQSKKHFLSQSGGEGNSDLFLPDFKEESADAVEKYLKSLPPTPGLHVSTACNSEFPALTRTEARPEKNTPMTMDIEAANTRTEVCSIGPESAICDESIPSTPEVSSDIPPKYAPACSPTLSHDSGAISLDNGEDAMPKPFSSETSAELPTSPTPSENSTVVPDESSSPIDSRSDSLEERVDSLEREELGPHGGCRKSFGITQCEYPSSYDSLAHRTVAGDSMVHGVLSDNIDQSQMRSHRLTEVLATSVDSVPSPVESL